MMERSSGCPRALMRATLVAPYSTLGSKMRHIRRLCLLALAACLALVVLPASGAELPSAGAAGSNSATGASATTLELRPIRAGFVASTSPQANYAAVDQLVVTSKVYTSYLAFDTSAVPADQRVVSATLDLYATGSVATAAGLVVERASASWEAAKLTYGTRPSTSADLSAPVLVRRNSSVSVALNDPASVEVDGITSLALTYRQFAPGVFLSKTGANAPRLKLQLQPASTLSGLAGNDALAFNPTNIGSPKVFAHYFTPYPVSLDNKPATSDYYQRGYLDPYGENSKHLAYGGLLRDRPLGRSPLTGDWQLAHMQTEVRQARAAGVDGFFVDVLSLTSEQWTRTVRLMDAATKENSGFVVVPQLDMTTSAGKASSAQVADKLVQLAAKPSQYRLADGRVVVSAFKAEAKDPSWWKQVIDLMANRGIRVAFSPVLLNASTANMARFAPISYGIGEWGLRSPGSVAVEVDKSKIAHGLGMRWIAPVAVQDSRPNQSVYWEAGNLKTLRGSWRRAIEDNADFVMIPTWNDYSENSSIAPSVSHGYTFADVNAYYAYWFKTGRAPTIQRDAMYVTHRDQPFAAVPTIGSKLMALTGGSATASRDTVEVLTMLTRSANVTVVVGGVATTYEAPAGVFAKTVPLRTGRVSATASRGGVQFASASSPVAVVSKPRVQDLQYFGVASRR